MMLRLMLRGLAHGKARFACAAAGIAAACGALVFMFSLTATNTMQAPARARAASAPWGAWQFEGKGDLTLSLVSCTIDYRPGGRVLQGPPMRAVIAAAPSESPYAAAPLVEGRWVDAAAPASEIVCTRRALMRFGRGTPPPLGTEIKFVGRAGTLTAKIVGYLADAQLPMGWPDVFANAAAFKVLADEEHGALALWKTAPETPSPQLLTPTSERVVGGFKGDAERRMDYARPLLLIAAVLTALCLLVNSLLLSVEANRRTLATLRTVGLTRGGVVALVLVEALFATVIGFAVGALGAMGALVAYVAALPAAFPMGVAFAWGAMKGAFTCALVLACVAALFALRPALAVRPLDALEERPRRRRRGMAVAFACGFAAFVAVEVWGASLMRGFVPSAEWPDAIVSILPEGVSAFDIEKLRHLPGVKRISELVPLQVNFEPEEEMAGWGGGRGGGRGGPRRRMCRNALLLAAEELPRFRFVEGTWEEAARAIRETDGCVIVQMISRARNLHVGDKLRLALPGRGPKRVAELPIVGVVDLNWHMVTSRGLVRGLNGASMMTDGAVFVSFDTIESLDPRPAAVTKMTHLWLDYEPAFLKEKGVFPAGRAVEAEIAKTLGLTSAQAPSTVRLHARDEVADGTLAHGDDLIGEIARVPFVFLAILALGFIAMLVAESDASKREFAVLRAVGATRLQLATRLAGTALRTAFWGVVFGFPVGAVAGWLASFKTGSFWPGLPHYFAVPWAVVAEGTVGALVFVLLVAIPTSLALLRRRR